MNITPRLTPREIQCLRGLACGEAPKQIAHRLGISTRTAEHYIAAARLKLRARTATHAVAIAMAAGLLTVPAVPASLGLSRGILNNLG